MNKTAIISAFPGCGKSYFHNNRTEYTTLDSDSSHFSWVKDENGNNTKERNPEFPINYINHIEENIGKVDVIFVSTHKEVRDALDERGIEYYIVKPEKDMKEDFINRYRKRGSSDSFIELLNRNWDNWLDELVCPTDPDGLRTVYLSKSEPYMADVLDRILFDRVTAYSEDELQDVVETLKESISNEKLYESFGFNRPNE